MKGDSPTPEPVARVPSEAGDQDALGQDPGPTNKTKEEEKQGSKKNTGHVHATGDHTEASVPPAQHDKADEERRKPARADEPFEKWERDEMEKMLDSLNGHLGGYFFVRLHFGQLC